ncbi:putative dehydrogenase [Alcanivorax nanhaiticus]|uniref:Putative dehydrogenase n=1 Tax=Alcanivorax nanhaiticus TaxID=1177154 RepID=A0A095TM29_9GAMM|nr:aldehyde reductase [Alcanivorax nanhaiticus]KGD63503.1 putative dehydrogenase [Alcanivorax nanhaiticus]
MSQSPRTVMVTGASGYIAGWIVKYLLEAGHTVHGTVRDPDKASSVAHLHRMAEASPGTLKLFKADLLDADSFDAPMQGCDVLMHTASPFVLDGFTDANEALVRPAVEGTRNVLNAANRCETLKRVVLTSSVASVYGDGTDMKGKSAFTEADWNTSSSVNHNPYQYSKVAAEREAWKIHDAQSRWDLVTINPGMVYGPSLTNASSSASIGTLLDMGRGKLKTGVPDLVYGVVDVRDVAEAHLLGAFTAEASGRYLLVSESVSMLGIARLLRQQFGSHYPFPKMKVPKPLVWLFGPMMGPVTRKFISRNIGYPVRFDNSRSKALGIQYRSVSETLKDHFEQVLEDGLVRRRTA